MLGVFPTWFQIRERGKQYAIAVRAQRFKPEVVGGEYDSQENLHLTNIHNLLTNRCNLSSTVINDQNFIRAIDPAYDWYTTDRLRYNYYTYPIPFHWRHPFLKLMNELVGPDGVKPSVTHNLPEEDGVQSWRAQLRAEFDNARTLHLGEQFFIDDGD